MDRTYSGIFRRPNHSYQDKSDTQTEYSHTRLSPQSAPIHTHIVYKNRHLRNFDFLKIHLLNFAYFQSCEILQADRKPWNNGICFKTRRFFRTHTKCCLNVPDGIHGKESNNIENSLADATQITCVQREIRDWTHSQLLIKPTTSGTVERIKNHVHSNGVCSALYDVHSCYSSCYCCAQ